jgi:hypothetical protein
LDVISKRETPVGRGLSGQFRRGKEDIRCKAVFVDRRLSFACDDHPEQAALT